MQKNKLALVVLAAGMGSRYGGLKQLDTFTPQNDTLIDLSVFDALHHGFQKIVFVIRAHFKADFEDLLTRKFAHKADIRFVCQEIDHLPLGFQNKNRVKPWGTAHALLCAKSEIDASENFLVINADDFYGRNAYKAMGSFLTGADPNNQTYAMVGYPLVNTLSDHGSVSRGECFVDDMGFLKSIVERTEIYAKGTTLFMKTQEKESVIDHNTIVSMNFWGFTPRIFDTLETLFINFLKENGNSSKAEFYIPSVVNELLKEQKASVKVLISDGQWIGVTYPNDKTMVMSKIKSLKETKVYPKVLWS